MKNYSEKYNLTFIHIPKNAGTSINEFLEISPENRGHKYPWELKKRSGSSFCIIRNPWDRMVSLYRFRKKKGHDVSLFSNPDYSFKEWLLNPNTPRNAGKMEWVNQVDIIRPLEEFVVDYILRYEYLNEDWMDFCNINNIPFKSLSHSNTSGEKKNYREYYDDETKNFVENVFSKDIKMLSYEF